MLDFNILLDRLHPSVLNKIYEDWMRRLNPGVHLLLTHISRMSNDHRAKIPVTFFREVDFACWTSVKTWSSVNESGIRFTGYPELQRLQSQKWENVTRMVRTSHGDLG